MSTLQIKESIIDKLDELDEQTLQAVHVLLNGLSPAPAQSSTEEIWGYEVDGTPITKDELMKDAVQQLEEVRKGNYTTYEDWKKETKEWLNSTK